MTSRRLPSGLVTLFAVTISLTTPNVAQSMSPQSIGFVVGGIQGRTDTAAERGEHARFFVRGELASSWFVEGGGGFGRLNGKDFATDIGLVDMKLLFLPLRTRTWRVYVGTGIGLVAHSIEQIPASATTGFDREGIGVTVPSALGMQLRLRDSLALEFSAGYAYTLRDDLDGAAIDAGNDGFWSAAIGLVIAEFGGRSGPPVRRFDPSYAALESATIGNVPVTAAARAPDQDGDGLTDHEETRQYYTNPLMADSDGDGAGDFEEVRDGTDPNRVDGDHARGPAAAMATTTRQEESAAEVVKTESIEFLLEPVSFRNGGARLTPQDKAYLGEVAAVLKQTPNLNLRLVGYSDSIGDARSNWRLSKLRSSVVADYLISRGIAPQRLIPEALGEQDPIGSNATRKGRALNRRVELVPQ